MKKLIYYPGFESTNEDWIKFALLYIGQLAPILPVKADNKRSDFYKKLNEETDLLSLHRPGFREGHEASLDVIDICEKIAVKPESFDMFFGKVNVIRNWKDKSEHTYTLYEEKYSSEWFRYCIDCGYATENEDGMALSETLATFYMTFLANKIADTKNISPITDLTHLDKLSYLLKKNAPVETNESMNAQAIINLKLPKRLNAISLDKIIKLRNSGDFKIRQSAFHDELKAFLSALETGDHSYDLAKKYNSSVLNFTELMWTLGQDSGQVSLAAWVLLNTVAPHLPDILKLATTASGVLIKQSLSISKTWKNDASKRNCRRYLADLGSLH